MMVRKICRRVGSRSASSCEGAAWGSSLMSVYKFTCIYLTFTLVQFSPDPQLELVVFGNMMFILSVVLFS
jgi:hypothetical protein